MRLLNTKTLKLTEFLDADHAPPYAILSHRWREGEVLFDHINNIAEAEKLQGFWKLKKYCETARDEGFDWAWIDTCCIDKTSSSELSEAINSMFSWYNKAEVCYAYLDDVDSDTLRNVIDPHAFQRSEWFTRGWTLQELISPKQVVFFAKDWSEIGTRKSLVDEIIRITHVDRDVLLGVKLPVELGVAERMSWASRRKMTRVEDMAYCLMGLFDVHMPTIYGEGKQAFIRLQHEIMRSTTDHSIFAWYSPYMDDNPHDVLAPEPSLFRAPFFHSHGIIQQIPFKDFAQLFRMEYSPEYTATNHGIRIRLPMKQELLPNGEHEYIAMLACQSENRVLLGLRLWPVEGTIDQYYRVGLTDIDNIDPESFAMKDVYLAHYSHSRALDVRPDVSIMLLPIDALHHYTPRQVYPPRRWKIGSSGNLSMTIANVRARFYCAVAVLQQENEHRNENIGVVFGVHYAEDYTPHRITASLLIDDGKGTWSTILSEPVVRCTSYSDKEAAELIWRNYQNETSPDRWDVCIDLETTCTRRFPQILLERGQQVIHLTTYAYVHPCTSVWMFEARIVSQANPCLTGWNLVWFLGSILQHIPTSDLESRVLNNIDYLFMDDAIAASTPAYFCRTRHGKYGKLRTSIPGPRRDYGGRTLRKFAFIQSAQTMAMDTSQSIATGTWQCSRTTFWTLLHILKRQFGLRLRRQRPR
ncbi:hypothetical protein A0H81_02795 [Grifola frondosa]|uniref:Uncharacterized protein n=1 Tax=Grifola frondosa TaxID=5627 RepID=A0A1C7MKD1_GRIFR|nr:hypothetical protein A0H81_02795 [Grifola frondosa]